MRFRIIFAGTPAFAVPALDALRGSEHDILEVWTQPDRPAGRGRKLKTSPVKRRAGELGLEVVQPASLKQAPITSHVAALAPDLFVVAAYGHILPRALLTTPEYGCLNIHASLLPRWRGAAPIQRAILAGDAYTGVSIMQMEAGLDSGAVLKQVETPIEAEDTAQTLHERLADLGARAMLATLADLARAGACAHRQDDARATYAAKIDKREAELDWRASAAALARQVRAFNPWPIAFTQAGGLRLRIFHALALPGDHGATPGAVLTAGPEGIDVAAGFGVLRILELQPAGKRRMRAAAFARARPIAGAVLGRASPK